METMMGVQQGLKPEILKIFEFVQNPPHYSAVKKLVLFHHEPTHDDKELERIERQARTQAGKMKAKFKVIGAREGMVLDV